MIIDTDSFTVKRLGKGEGLDPAHAALVIVDMMNRFCDAEWLAGGDAARERWFRQELDRVIPNVLTALEVFRRHGGLVVHVVNAKWTEEGREAVPYQRGRDYGQFDSEAMSVIEPLAPRPGEILIRKVTSSAFTGTGLDFLLRNAGIERVVLSGQFGNACVFYSLIQSREFGFDNVWLEDGLLYSTADDAGLFPALVGSRWAKLASAAEVSAALSVQGRERDR